MSEDDDLGWHGQRLSDIPTKPLSNSELARCLAVVFKRVQNQIGRPPAGCSSLHEATKFYLERAREHSIHERDYEVLYFLYRTTGAKAAAQ